MTPEPMNLREAGSVEVWGWAKRGARGKRKLWTLKRYMKCGGEWWDIDTHEIACPRLTQGAATRGEEQR